LNQMALACDRRDACGWRRCRLPRMFATAEMFADIASGSSRLGSARREARGPVAENLFKYYHEDNKNLHRRNPLC
jgi:hypothetical protein